MSRYIAIRIGHGVIVVLGAVAISFFLVNVTGDPITAIGGVELTPSERQALIHHHGYDRPVGERFVSYMAGVLHGDFGESFTNGEKAFRIVMDALPATLSLVVGSILITVIISIPVAVLAVLHRGSVFDRAVRSTLMGLQGLPPFWIGVMMVLIFSVQLGWLPSYGDNGVASYIMPIAALSIPLLSTVVRLLRSDLMDIMGMEFVTALRAKGLSEREIVTRHALRNALVPLLTFMALQIGWVVGGTIIVEAVFGWPGIGSVAITAANAQDLAVIQAVVVIIAIVKVLLTFSADLAALAVDPRLRAQS